MGGSDLPAQAKGGPARARGEGTALPGFARAGVAAAASPLPHAAPHAPHATPVPATSETHNNGGSGLPEGTALPGFGAAGAAAAAAAIAGPGPATPAAAVDTTLARAADPAPPPSGAGTPEGTALPGFGSTSGARAAAAPPAVDAPQPELKTASIAAP